MTTSTPTTRILAIGTINPGTDQATPPDAPPKDATLPQEELEAAALAKMGWSHIRRE